MKVIIVGVLLSFCCYVFAENTLPSDAIYQVGGNWQTQEDKTIRLENLSGKPQVVALIFTGCSTACPVIVESMKRIEKKVPVNKRDKIGFVLVTLTPDTDTPKSLSAFAEKKNLNSHWTLLRGTNETVRELANALNGRYKMAADGDVIHSNTVTLLNSQGQISLQAPGTLNGIQPMLEKVESDIKNGSL